MGTAAFGDRLVRPAVFVAQLDYRVLAVLRTA